MVLLKTDSKWEVRAPAKVNLLLEVLARRDDGFHEIETLMVPIGLFDSLEFRSDATGQIELTCQWATAGTRSALDRGPTNRPEHFPEGTDNIVVRAARLLRERSGTTCGASIRLVKRIPIAAGLGGGSSDAAATLAVANAAWNLNWSAERLSMLAAELGSDVPFFVGQTRRSGVMNCRGPGPAICRGRGEAVQPVDGLGRLHFVVAKPPVGLSTAKVFAASERPSASRAGESAVRIDAMITALRRGALARAASLLHNHLQTAAESLSPWIARLKREFDRIDCLGHHMSGSGSSYFGVCRTARHARRAAGLLRARDVGRVYAVSSCF